jgi:site-specific DNA-methyltransferase (adenine-specific)
MHDKTWAGYGYALKPAYEPIILAMKPLDGSFQKNAKKWGVAGLNTDGCRIGSDEITINRWTDGCKPFGNGAGRPYDAHCSQGRFPANLMLDEEAAHLLDSQSPIHKGGKYRKTGKRDRRHKGQQLYGGGIGGGQQDAPDCYGDAGGASRFFYCPKASKQERNAGLDGFPIDRPDKRDDEAMGFFREHGVQPQRNPHPCVKPLALTEWLARLILPPERSEPRKLLVPYCGSGSEMIGAMLAGWDEVLGIERERKYIDIAKARIKQWRSQG